LFYYYTYVWNKYIVFDEVKRKKERKKERKRPEKKDVSHQRREDSTTTYLNDDFDVVVGLVDIASSGVAVGANSNADDETEREGVCFRVVLFVEEKCAEGKTAPKARGGTTGKNDVERRERAKKNEGKEKKLRARGRRRAATTAATEFFFFTTTTRRRRNKNDGGDGD